MNVSRETIEGVYSFPWDVDTKFIDACTWIGAYTNGYREPHYPMPALRLAVLISYVVGVYDFTNEQWVVSSHD